MRMTRKMVLCQEKNSIDLARDLPALLNEKGLSRTAEQLGISKATLGYWLLKLGIEIRRIAVSAGDRVEVTRDG